MRPGISRLQAATLLVGLMFAMSVGFWHHDHATPGIPSNQRGGSAVDEGERWQDCNESAAGPVDGCPICLSQRLLSQLRVEGRKEAGRPAACAFVAPPRVEPVAFALIRPRAARAPPLV
jgi:hypothetical protein